jgi:alkylation response protein AidB-like acyl-CoA dehydrogenase
MKFEITPQERLFREEVREWLQANTPVEPRPTHGPEMRVFDLAWQKAQFEGGWAGITWPKEHGGCGLSLVEQIIWHEEYALAGAPSVGCCFVGLNHAGPTIIARGTDEQRAFHLPKILRGEVIWCQGFSEPGAGSDLASLQTAAVIEGDQLVVQGSKIWTSYAQFADYQELLVRTTRREKKQDGITWTICDMKSPGVSIRPILTMADPLDYHFCQVFYDGVRIPLSNVVGAIDAGWSVANATLGFERGSAFMAEQIHHAELVEQLIAKARAQPGVDGEGSLLDDGDIAARLATARAEMAAMRALTYAAVSHAGRGSMGPEGSVTRLFYSEAHQRIMRLAYDILGPRGLESPPGEGWSRSYLRSFAATIAAGASDIQRNIIGERILGLPRSGSRS